MKKELILAGLIFTIISLVFFYPIFKGFIPFPGDVLVNTAPYSSYSYTGYAPGGVPNKAQGPDVIRQLFPWKYFTIGQYKSFQWPLWNPYNFSGNPHLANLQSGPFYFINLLFLFVPFLFSWTIYIVLQPILSGLFTYLFLRSIKLAKIPSVYGGIVFAFSAFMIVWIQYGNLGHTLLWLPLVLFLINIYFEKQTLFRLLAMTVVLSFSILAGYIQLAIYTYLFSLAFVFYHFIRENNKKKVWKKYAKIIIVFILPLPLCAIQLLPLLEFLQNSLRTPYVFNQLSERLIPVFNTITIIFPDFFGNPVTRNYWLSGTYIERASYIGILSILLAIYAIYRAKIGHKLFFLGGAVVSYLSALDLLPIKLFHAIGIPILSTGVPSRILSIFSFCMAVLAAIGLDAWIKEDVRKKYRKTFFVFLGLIAIIWLSVLFNHSNEFYITRKNLILPTAILLAGGFILLIGKFPKKIAAILILLLTIFDLFYLFKKFTPFSPREYVYPKTDIAEKLKSIQGIDRHWGYGKAYIDANYQLYEKNYSPEGYDALYLKRYGEVLSATKDGKIAQNVPRAVANIAPGYGSSDLKENHYRQKILNLLGIKYLLNIIDPANLKFKPTDNAFYKSKYKLIWQKGGWQIYENEEVLPRVFLLSNYILETNKNKIIENIFNDKINLRDTVILEENLPSDFKINKNGYASVLIQSYSPNKIILKTKSDNDKILFLSDNYFVGWQATVDGKNVKIYRADYSFRAVPIKSGDHEVVFQYYPDSFNLGLKISILTLTGIAICVLLIKLKKINV